MKQSKLSPPLWLGLGALALLAGLGWAWLRMDRGPAAAPALAAKPDGRLQCALPPQASTAAQQAHPGMVWVPPGSYTMGDTRYPEEQPLRQTTVAGFWMDRTEVTNDQFAEFVKATGYVTVAERPVDARSHPGLPPDMLQPGAVVFMPPRQIQSKEDVSQWWRYMPGANWRHPGGPTTSLEGRGSFPVVAVTLEDAQAYARWKGHALPTEAQWGVGRACRHAAAHARPRTAQGRQHLAGPVSHRQLRRRRLHRPGAGGLLRAQCAGPARHDRQRVGADHRRLAAQPRRHRARRTRCRPRCAAPPPASM